MERQARGEDLGFCFGCGGKLSWRTMGSSSTWHICRTGIKHLGRREDLSRGVMPEKVRDRGIHLY